MTHNMKEGAESVSNTQDMMIIEKRMRKRKRH